jgi:hypothetical protein
VTFRGGTPGRPDPEKMLDDALAESFQEISQQGSGVEAEDVVAGTRQRRQPSADRSQRRTERTERRDDGEPDRDEQGRFLPRRERRAGRAAPIDPAEDLRSLLTDDEETEEERQPRRPRRTSAPTDDYDDDLDEDDDGDDRPLARRRRDVDEDEDDDLDPEDARVLEDDEDDEQDERPSPRQARRRDDDDADDDEGDRPRRKRWSKRQETAIQREVQRQVQSVVAENERLREQQTQRAKVDQETRRFLEQALGSPERRNQLEQIVLNTRLPQQQRDAAATELATYKRNEGFFSKYKAGAEAMLGQAQAADDKAAIDAMAELRPLDPKIVNEGNRAKTLVHAYATGRALGQQEAAKEIRRLRRLLETQRGVRDERRPQRINGASGVASASGRRANGRVAAREPMRGSMGKQRGLRPGSTFNVPIDEMLQRIKDKDATLADYGLGRVTI